MMVPCISGELKVERANLSDIGGGKEPGMMYFPTKWGAKSSKSQGSYAEPP